MVTCKKLFSIVGSRLWNTPPKGSSPPPQELLIGEMKLGQKQIIQTKSEGQILEKDTTLIQSYIQIEPQQIPKVLDVSLFF